MSTSIKKSFADCLSCELLNCNSCIFETNCTDDLSKVDVVYVAEHPGEADIEEMRPLVGRSGKLFRMFFEKFDLHKHNYLIVNTVLCQTLNEDGTSENPSPEVVERCKVNAMNLIKQCNPKLVVIMGASPMNAFDIAKAGITEIAGKYYEWEGFKVFLTVHPSFVDRNKEVWIPIYESHFERVADFMNGNMVDEKSFVKRKKGIFRYSIPEKFYTEKYRLIDVHEINKTKEVLYIFRDDENNKVYHRAQQDFVCYQAESAEVAKKIVPYDDLYQVHMSYRDRFTVDPNVTYESDVRLTTKHAMDYYHYNKGETKTNEWNIMFFDIEVDTGDKQVFPFAADADYPINMITTKYNGVKTTFVVPHTENGQLLDESLFEDTNIIRCRDETILMTKFIRDLKEKDPDYITGWNVITYDLLYIFNRLPKLGMDYSVMSKFREFYVDGEKSICNLVGTVALDQLVLYKKFTFTKLESYALGYVGQHELRKTKIQLPLPFNEMYWKMLNKTVEYNIRDVDLIDELEAKLGHIKLLNEIRNVCTTAFEAGSTSSGQIDSLCVNFLKERNSASKNTKRKVKEKYPGAFVLPPKPGIYDWFVDFDYTSLYPSIIKTYNLGIDSFVMKTKDPYMGYHLAHNIKGLPDNIEVIIDPLNKAIECTVTKGELFDKVKKENLIMTINGCFFVGHGRKISELSQIVASILDTRKMYKAKMFKAIDAKNKTDEDFYFTRQLVYKVLANTLYGVVATKGFRFFDISIATAITLGGQEALKHSIIEGEAFMKSLDKETEYSPPVPLTKDEYYAATLPERKTKYIITGDTDSIFCCFRDFKDHSIDAINKHCKTIQTFLNKDIMTDLVLRHNVDPEFNALELKNEVICSRGLFLAKKHYVTRVIMNEGIKVDKMNYMGVAIKRSDYPSQTKDFLRELMEIIMKDEKFSMKKVMNFIKENQIKFRENTIKGDKTLARPVSWNKTLADYKVMPQGVRSMLAWNNIMYSVHQKGSRAYMYWIKGLDYSKAPRDIIEKYEKHVASMKAKTKKNPLNVIAIPDNEEGLPDYFIIDVDASMAFTFEARYNLMLEPIFSVRSANQVLQI
jgi:uracil-DNA glycosylase family 4